MLVRKIKYYVNNFNSTIIFYSYLLFIPFATLFNNPIKLVYSLFCITIFLLRKNDFSIIKRKDYFSIIKRNDLIPIIIELLCVSYSFYYIPRSIKYIITLIALILVYLKFKENKEEFFSKINFSQIFIILSLFLFPLIITSINDIFIYGYFGLEGYIQIIRNFVLLFIGIYTFNNYKNIEIIIRPLFVSSLMHAIINISIKLNLTNFNYLSKNAFFFTFDWDYVGKMNQISNATFSTNIILLFIIPAIYYLYKNKYLYFAISYVGLSLSGTRTGTIIVTAALFIYILNKINFQKFISKRNIKFFLVIIFFAIFFSFSEFQQLFNLLRLNSYNNNGFDIRLGYIDYFLENINFTRKLFGFGINGPIYNSYKDIFDKTEISQLNYIYYYGLIVGCFAFVTYLRLIIINFKNSVTAKISQSDFKILSITAIYIFITAGSQEILTHPIIIFLIIFLSSNDNNLLFNTCKENH